MILSRQHQILFIHIPRTGGTSISNLLLKQVPDAAHILDQHSTAADARRLLGSEFDRYQKISFVRNPWERLVSWYSLLSKGPKPSGIDGAAHSPESFDEFLIRFVRARADHRGPSQGFPDQFGFLTDENEDFLVNEVGRYERFQADLTRILDRYGISAGEIPRVNTSCHAPYREFYSLESREIAQCLLSRDATSFDYHFDGNSHES